MTKIQVNSQGKAYYTSGGKVLMSTATSPVINSLSITPSTSSQTITASGGVDGYSPISVSAVTSSIDSNISAANIVSGVSILGVSGSAIELNGDTLSVTPSTLSQTLTPTSPKNGFTEVSVSAVTSSIDANITAGNIKDGVTILGVTGSYTGSGGSTKYGLSVDNFIGNTTNGVLGTPRTVNGITFTGVTEIPYNCLSHLFKDKGVVTGAVSFPDLTTVDSLGMQEAFSYNQITSVNLSALTTVGNTALMSAFQNNQITSVDLSALTTVDSYGLLSAFQSNQITSVDLSALTTVGSSGLEIAFQSNQITSVDLSALTTVGSRGLADAFQNNQITSVDLSALTTVGDNGLENAFGSNKITSVVLSALTSIGASGLMNAFINNGYYDDDSWITTLQSVSFPALIYADETSFELMLRDNDGVTVHFPSNLQSVMENWSSVMDGFGGTNTTVLFDLPATN